MDADPHVLHVRSSAGLYGAEYVLLGLIPALQTLGIGSTLLCLDNPLLSEQTLYLRAQALGVPAQRVPCAGRIDYATVSALRVALRQRPDALLHVHDYKSAFYAWLARLRTTTCVVATSHGQFAETRNLRWYQQLEKWLMRRFDHVCIVSSEMRSMLVEAGVASSNISLIENGIDTERFRPDVEPLPRAAFGIPEDACLFGSAIRLRKGKNPLGLLEAFAALAKRQPRAWLVLAGEGPLRAAILARATELGIAGRVRLLGARDDLEHYYPMLDCFVLPSHYEGLPLALLEAMAAARPVISTSVGQVPAVVDGLPVALVPPADIAALSAAMQAVMDGRTGPRNALRQRVIDRYSAMHMAQAYAALYRRLWTDHGHAAH